MASFLLSGVPLSLPSFNPPPPPTTNTQTFMEKESINENI